MDQFIAENSKNYDNRDREIEGLFEAMDFFKLKTGTLITKNQKDVFKKGNNTVQIVKACEFIEKLGD